MPNDRNAAIELLDQLSTSGCLAYSPNQRDQLIALIEIAFLRIRLEQAERMRAVLQTVTK